MTNEQAINEIKKQNCHGYKNMEMCQWAGEGFGTCEECCYHQAIQALQAQAENRMTAEQALDLAEEKAKQIKRKLKPLADGEMCPICGNDSSHLCYVSKDDGVWAECLRCGSRVLIKESKIAFYKFIAENINPNEYQWYYEQYYHTTDEKVGGRE